MKVLSLHNPWAFLMMHGKKRIETRDWQIGFRGVLLIHSTKKFDNELIWMCREEPFRSVLLELGITHSDQMPIGSGLCLVELKQIHRTEDLINIVSGEERAFGNYGAGRFGWVFSEERVVLPEPIRMRGLPGLWDTSQADPQLDRVLRELWENRERGGGA